MPLRIKYPRFSLKQLAVRGGKKTRKQEKRRKKRETEKRVKREKNREHF